MILICPSCSTRYLLSASAIGDGGRDVRCAKCQHEWFADSDVEDVVEAAETDIEPDAGAEDDSSEENSNEEEQAPEESDSEEPEADSEEPELDDKAPPLEEEPIPDSVKPLPEGSNVPAFASDVLAGKASLQARLTGYGAALLVFIALVVGGVVLKQKITAFWPPAAVVYEIAGIPATFQGEGLVMESLSATIFKDNKGNDILVLKGRVINITEHVVTVPKMIATLRSTNGEDGEGWFINSPVDEVEAGASFAFLSNYPAVPNGVGSVNLSFIPAVDGIKAEQVASVETTDAEAPHHGDKEENDEHTPRSPDEEKHEAGHKAPKAEHHEPEPKAEHHEAEPKAEHDAPAHH